MFTHLGPDLDELGVGHTVGLKVDAAGRLHLLVNGVDQGVAAEHIPDRSARASGLDRDLSYARQNVFSIFWFWQFFIP